MALFPQGMTNVDRRCNAGERRVFNHLKRCLTDDFIVWHDVPIGPRARQPDFVIVSPRWGLLVLEVKDWRQGTMVSANRDTIEIDVERGSSTVANPLRQARDYVHEVVDVMKSDASLLQQSGSHTGNLLFPYGWGCVFSGLRRAQVAMTGFSEVFPENLVLMRDELDANYPVEIFLEKLFAMFSVRYPCNLTMPQLDRIRWHLFPELRLTTQAALDFASGGAPISLPDLLEVMDLHQEQVARTLGAGHRVIHGVAGSGKTMVLVYRAEQLAAAARPDRPVLVLCFNKPLSLRIDAMLRLRGVDERVRVMTFHAWCSALVRQYQLQVRANLSGADYYEELASVVERAVLETNQVPGGQYLALLVDEAHDFEETWLRIATRMVDPTTNSLLILYDDAQSIYRKRRDKLNFSRVGIQAVGRTHILKLNYRNTAEILSVALHCAHGLFNERTVVDGEAPIVAPSTAGRRGPMPVLVRATSETEEAALIAERVAGTIADGGRPEEVVILCRYKRGMEAIQHRLRRQGIEARLPSEGRRHIGHAADAAVMIETMHRAKGLEFKHVFVSGLHTMPMRDESMEDAVQLLYVAMTRATHQLTLFAAGASPIVDRVGTSIKRVGNQLA